MNMTDTIEAKSDQLNADDLIGRSITIKVAGVALLAGDQPCAISYEGDNGKPYRPGKSMRRVLVHVWGPDAAKYVGRMMTLYRDDDVQFGGLKVGGIRISHMTGISEPVTMALTAKKGSKKAFKVLPLRVEQVTERRRTARDLLAAIKARADAGDTLEAIEASEEVALIRTKGSDAAKAELGALLSSLIAPEGEPAFDGEPAEAAP